MKKHGARVRVEVTDLPASVQRGPREKVNVALVRAFKRACQDYGISHMMKEHEYYMSKGQKRRRRKLRAKLALIKKLTEPQVPQKPAREWED